jgi:cell division protein FtsQ
MRRFRRRPAEASAAAVPELDPEPEPEPSELLDGVDDLDDLPDRPEDELQARRVDVSLLIEAPVDVDEPEPAEAPAVDPEVVVLHDKMRRRRISVRREEGRRRLKRLAWGLGAVVVVIDGAALAHTTILDVDHVEVVGATHVSADTVKWASGIGSGDALLTLDSHGAARRIRRLSWVADVRVEKRWPSTVRLVVEERTPAAVIRTRADGAFAVVDASGRVLQIGGQVPPGLVAVTDVRSRLHEGGRLPASAQSALRVAVAANQRAPGALTAVSTGLEGTLTRGGVVRFGSVDRLDEKLLAVSTVLARVDVACLKILDVKVPGSPTVSRGSC